MGGIFFHLKEFCWKFRAEVFDGVGLVAVGDEEGVVGLDDNEVVYAEEGDAADVEAILPRAGLAAPPRGKDVMLSYVSPISFKCFAACASRPNRAYAFDASL